MAHDPILTCSKANEDNLNIDLQAFILVNNPYFKQFIYELDSHLQLPSQQTLHNLIISKFASQKDLIKNFISSLSYKVTLTTNIWSSCAMISYIATTCYFINNNWQFCYILLDIFEIPSPYTGQTISNIILSLLEEYIRKQNFSINF
ncbi:43628_t:CDS:2 [Gigaspora margarita]|uniref:43628_t:CDS:1 n=1 Tax=Gigaspora margarita TaxID=4874 RepID=A0ABM8VXF9_GIGMA|nr:43628_t:CDS:2 [Gigaspora margarita]